MKKYIITIDEGTTSEKVSLFDTSKNKIIASHSLPLSTSFPQNGWVEQSADEIWEKVKTSLSQIITDNKLNSENVIGIGITNQREAVVAFNKNNGKALAPIISWQCKRTADFCNKLPQKTKDLIQDKTGLVIDSYFSATKMKWLLENNKNVIKSAKSEDLALGTIDSYLIYKLTNGTSFSTDTSNASRTMLTNLNNPFEYDSELLKFFGIKKTFLPKILNSADNFGTAQICGLQVPILSCIGDQQSSLVGQGCFNEGSAKITYGTGGFLLINHGTTPSKHNEKLLTTVAYSLGGQTIYAIEGSIFNVGSTLDFIKNHLNLFDEYKFVDTICKTNTTDGLLFFPTFSGIGAPFWNPNLRGGIYGMTLATTKEQITKATVESFVYCLQEILDYLTSIKIKVTDIRCDGGLTKNKYLLDFQASLTNIPVLKTEETESTTLGATYLAGLSAKTYSSLAEIEKLIKIANKYQPTKQLATYSKENYKIWHNHLQKLLQP